MENKYKLITKILDYCFKNLDDIVCCGENFVQVNILDKEYCVSRFFDYLESGEIEVVGIYNKSANILRLENIPSSEINLIRYKLSKLFEEFKLHEVSMLENFLDNPSDFHKITSINEFNYDEDKC